MMLGYNSITTFTKVCHKRQLNGGLDCKYILMFCVGIMHTMFYSWKNYLFLLCSECILYDTLTAKINRLVLRHTQVAAVFKRQGKMVVEQRCLVALVNDTTYFGKAVTKGILVIGKADGEYCTYICSSVLKRIAFSLVVT